MRNIPLKSRKICSPLFRLDVMSNSNNTPCLNQKRCKTLSINIMKKTLTYNFRNQKNYITNPTFHDLYVSPVVMENPTYDPNSVSNILSYSTLPDFPTEMTLTILICLLASRCLTPGKIKPIITAVACS